MNFSELVGKTVSRIERGEDYIKFFLADGSGYWLHHYQSCCESVNVEDVAGDLEDLVGSPIVMAEESSNSEDPPKEDYEYSYTWTFYRISTAKGLVVIRFYGSSNGYYGEGVDFDKL